MNIKSALFLQIAVVLMGCGAGGPAAQAQSIESWNAPCVRLLAQYKSRPGHKAFALTSNTSGAGVSQYCGAAWGAGSRQTAESQAVSSCNAKKIGSPWNGGVSQPARCKVTRSE